MTIKIPTIPLEITNYNSLQLFRYTLKKTGYIPMYCIKYVNMLTASKKTNPVLLFPDIIFTNFKTQSFFLMLYIETKLMAGFDISYKTPFAL